MISVGRLRIPCVDIDLKTHMLLGWPRRANCPKCCAGLDPTFYVFNTARALFATNEKCAYQCDECHFVFEAQS